MWRRQATARLAGQKGHLTLKMPDDMPGDFPAELVDQAVWVWRMSGYRHLPHPYELLYMPDQWVEAVVAFERGVQFFEDYSKRPAKLF